MSMLRAATIVVLMHILASCQSPTFYLANTSAEDQDIDVHFETFSQAWRWVAENIEYEADPPGGQWQSPEITVRRRKGDCEDFARLLAYFGTTLGEEVLVVELVRGKSYHCVNEYEGRLIEPQAYCLYINTETSGWNISRKWTYEEAYYDTTLRSTK